MSGLNDVVFPWEHPIRQVPGRGRETDWGREPGRTSSPIGLGLVTFPQPLGKSSQSSSRCVFVATGNDVASSTTLAHCHCQSGLRKTFLIPIPSYGPQGPGGPGLLPARPPQPLLSVLLSLRGSLQGELCNRHQLTRAGCAHPFPRPQGGSSQWASAGRCTPRKLARCIFLGAGFGFLLREGR